MLPMLLSEIQKLTGAQLYGNPEYKIYDICTIRDIQPGKNNSGCLTWVNDKNSNNFNPALQPGLLILSPNAYLRLQNAALNFLVTLQPRNAFFTIIDHCFTETMQVGISSTSVISSSAKLGESCYIGHNVVIEDGVQIGNYCRILHNTVILRNTNIGNHVTIGCNCTIGSAGFGYEKNELGVYKQLPHAGNVLISDHVNIHNNSCIDRAVIGSTIIGEEVKIDNLVHIAHGVRIGHNSLVIANAMVGGSTDIGENCWISPSVSLNNGLKIANENMIGTGAVVTKSTQTGKTYVGNPAAEMDEIKKWSALRKRLLNES
jgi:UDP-3-O-[3-hydroxymyristoyl] glucosamine N-acyltransferase